MGIIEKNIKWFFSVILLLYAGCSPCFNTLQTARMLPPKTVEFTPSVSWFSELDPEFLWYQRCYGGRTIRFSVANLSAECQKNGWAILEIEPPITTVAIAIAIAIARAIAIASATANANEIGISNTDYGNPQISCQADFTPKCYVSKV